MLLAARLMDYENHQPDQGQDNSMQDTMQVAAFQWLMSLQSTGGSKKGSQGVPSLPPCRQAPACDLPQRYTSVQGSDRNSAKKSSNQALSCLPRGPLHLPCCRSGNPSNGEERSN